MNIFGALDSLFSRFRRNKNISAIPDESHTIIRNQTIISPYSGSGYYGQKFPGGLGVKTPIDIFDHQSIRQQVRKAMTDSVECRSLVTSIIDTVVDTGLRLKPTPIPEILKISPEQAELWAEDIAQRFHLWAKSKKSSRNQVNTFYQNQRLYQLSQQRDNDIFVKFNYSRRKNLTSPLQIEFIEPNQIRGFGYTSTYAQCGYDDGIIRDTDGVETAYKVWMRQTNGTYKDETIPAVGEKSGRIFMIHGFSPEYAGQGRGFSKMAHLIQELSDLTDFKTSTIQKAINQASFVGKVENEFQDASQPLEGQIAGPVKEYGAYPEPSIESGNVTPDSISPVINWDIQTEATIRQPGSFVVGNLRRGDKLEFLRDTSPSEAYNEFVSSFFSSICASTGWSEELVLKKFNNNYSASRATLILCWRTAIIERMEMEADFLEPVYEMWLAEDIAAGRTAAPGWSDPFLRQAWLSCEWAGVPMPNIDPLKTAQSDEKYVELGAQTLDDVARNLNGSSGKANRIKIARQYQELPTPPWPRAPITVIPDNEGNNGG